MENEEFDQILPIKLNKHKNRKTANLKENRILKPKKVFSFEVENVESPDKWSNIDDNDRGLKLHKMNSNPSQDDQVIYST